MQTLKPQDLQSISRETIHYYDQHANEFWEGTKEHDVTQNYRALLEALSRFHKGKLDLLDFGCGPGRDLLYFKNLGHHVVGLDGSTQFCRMARDHSGCEVIEQDFLQLNLRAQSFDGIFANASLFHIPSQELPRVLGELWKALRHEGVLFTSNPRGKGEGWTGGRYGNFMELEIFKKHLDAAGFMIENHYYRPAGKPCDQQPWLAVVSRKVK